MGEVILEALLSSGIAATIVHLNLGYNRNWFSAGGETNVDMLADFIRYLPLLEVLNLGYNTFSSLATTKVLSSVAEQCNVRPLKELNLRYSANFESDEAVQMLADIIADSLQLAKIKTGSQRSSRKISVAVTYATEDAPGAVMVSESVYNRNTYRYEVGQELCGKETQKQQASNEIEIRQR